MPHMRFAKKELKRILTADDWRSSLPEIAAGGKANIGALFSFLLLEPEIMHRAAAALGLTVARLAEADLDAAKNIIRRFMWHMSEESGNIGWGIPAAFAESLCASPVLAKTYANILVSYIIDLGFDDNYCDNDILRRSCFWAIGRFAQAEPMLAEKSRQWLVKGLADPDSICRGMAAWALGQLPPSLMAIAPLRKLACSGDVDECEIFNGQTIQKATVAALAAQTLAAIGKPSQCQQ